MRGIGKQFRAARPGVLVAALLMAGMVLGTAQMGMAAEPGLTEAVALESTTVDGVLVRANEMGEGYFLSVEKADGSGQRVVLTMTPESEITINGINRTPDQFLETVRIGKDRVNAVYFVNFEGMKHVLTIAVASSGEEQK